LVKGSKVNLNHDIHVRLIKMEGRSSIKSGMYNSLDSCYLFETYRQLYNELSILLSVWYLMPSLIGVILPKSTSQSSRQDSRQHNTFSSFRPCLVSKKFPTVPIISNLRTHTWGIKCKWLLSLPHKLKFVSFISWTPPGFLVLRK